MKSVSSPNRATSLPGVPAMDFPARTAGMALVEFMMLFAAIKAKDFKEKPTVRNLTDWANAVQLIDDPYDKQSAAYRRTVRHSIRRKISA